MHTPSIDKLAAEGVMLDTFCTHASHTRNPDKSEAA